MQFAEIRHDYIWGEAVENGLNHRAGDPLLAAVSIDAWETGDDDEEGRVVANVLLSRHGDIIVDFHDNGVRMDQQVLEHIAEAKTDLRRIWEEYTAAQRQAAVHVKSLGCTAELRSPAMRWSRSTATCTPHLRMRTRARIILSPTPSSSLTGSRWI